MIRSLPLFALPFLALAALPTVASEPHDRGLTQLMEKTDAAWNAHDADQQVALYANDGCLVTPTGTRACGRAAIKKVVGGKGPTAKTQSKTTIDGVQSLGDGLVLIDATQKLTGAGTKMIGTDRARVVVVAKQVKGEWKLLSVRPFPSFKKAARTAKR